jgi:hypothetical protein
MSEAGVSAYDRVDRVESDCPPLTLTRKLDKPAQPRIHMRRLLPKPPLQLILRQPRQLLHERTFV